MKENWTYKKLGEVAEIYQPKTLSTEMLIPNGKYLVYGANGVIGRYNEYNHKERELLVTCRGATCGTINVSEPESWVNGNAMVVHSNTSTLNFDYLKYTLHSVDWSLVITGAAQPQITRQKLSPVIIPLPPLSEQQSIVRELDLLNDLIAKKRAQVAEYDQLQQSLFYTMFGDPVTNEKSWEVKKLGEVCSVKGRIGFRGYTRNDFVESAKDGAISLSPTNIIGKHMDYEKCSYISWEKYEESPEIIVNNGDILLVKTGSSYGKCALVTHLPHKATINPQFVVIKEHKIVSRYLEAYLQGEAAHIKYEEFVLGTAIPTFSQKSLNNMPILCPPLPLQQEFAKKVEAIEALKAKVNDSIRETETLLASRMDYYFG